MNIRNESKNNELLQRNTYTCRILLFILINLIVITFSLYCFYFKNTQNLDLLNYPANSQGQSCYTKYKESYPFLYIDLTFSAPRYRCVNQCPTKSNFFTIMDSRGQTFLQLSIEEQPNQRLGGICWSSQKENLLKQRGLFMEFQSKSIILNKFTSICYLCIVAFFLGTASAIVFYWFTSRLFYYFGIILSFGLLGYFIYYIAKSNFLLYKKEVITLIGLTLFFYILNLLMFKKRLEDSIKFSQQVKNRFQNSSQSSVSKFLKCLSISMAFSIIHCFLLLLILYEYIGIVSNEKLVKKQNEVYYNINRTWWKYLLLLCHWLLLSNLFQKTYQYLLVKLGYRLIMKQNQGSPCFTFSDLLNIYVFALIQTILWIPLKIILIFKPEGSIVRKNDKETFCQLISRCCFCCCGVGINYLHKFTFNPYLVLALQPSFDDLDNSLALVQQVYHKHDPSYEKTSLWLGRLSNYINISIISSCLVQFLAIQQASSPFSNLFIIFAVVVAIQICQYNLTMWSLLSEIAQFVQLIGAGKNRDIIV